MTEQLDPEVMRFTTRFRKIGNAFARMVNDAYDGDRARALSDSNAEVLATVRSWEIDQGLTPRDWVAQGRSEGRD